MQTEKSEFASGFSVFVGEKENLVFYTIFKYHFPTAFMFFNFIKFRIFLKIIRVRLN